jgi:hypothetical protein
LRNTGTEIGREREMVLSLLELASSAQQTYKLASPASRREMAIRLCSNLTVARKDVSIEPYYPLRLLRQGAAVPSGAPHPTATRTSVQDIWRMYQWAKRWNARRTRFQGGARHNLGATICALRPAHPTSVVNGTPLCNPPARCG